VKAIYLSCHRGGEHLRQSNVAHVIQASSHFTQSRKGSPFIFMYCSEIYLFKKISLNPTTPSLPPSLLCQPHLSKVYGHILSRLTRDLVPDLNNKIPRIFYGTEDRRMVFQQEGNRSSSERERERERERENEILKAKW
jgi:hypothetical protein